MKKLLLIVLILGSCKKQNLNIIYPSGTRFDLKNISLNSLAQMHNGIEVIPENPFIIDDIMSNSAEAVTYYDCHSANGNVYQMPENNMQIISTPRAGGN
jgi:hypothetical protein